MKVKVIENKLYEERLLLQQKNDEEIQKVGVSHQLTSCGVRGRGGEGERDREEGR